MGLAGSASGLPVFLEASCVASLSFPASCPDSCASRGVGSDRTATIVSQKLKQTFSLYSIFLIHLKEQNRGNIPSRYDHHVAWLKRNVFALTCYGHFVRGEYRWSRLLQKVLILRPRPSTQARSYLR